ncbi:hypothetical protein [Dongia mobilis]|jgi:hypothetical protein|uniref:hypothetical protein n=1 Tax=Dongia sp. TaxID=1977262 RepID=UPI0026EF754F
MAKHDFLKGSKASRIIWHQAQGIAGQPGRSLDAALFSGQVAFASGERGTYIGCEIVGTIEDPGAFSGNAIILLADGSVSTQTFVGRSETANGPDRFAGTGTWRMESGTGRFAGLQGSGPFRWSMIGDDYEEEFSD